MNQTQIKRIHYLDIFKGIGIILVAIGHIYHNSIIFNWIYSFHMPLFFFAAGWVYKEKPILEDIKRRIQTIVVPYFCFGTLTLVYWQLIERRFRDSNMSFGSAVLGFISGQEDRLDFNVHLWFLPCFFVIVVLFNALVKFMRGGQRGLKSAVLISIAMSAVYAVKPLPSLPWGLDRILKFIGFYALGTLCAKQVINRRIEDLKIPVRWIIAAVLLTASFTLSYGGLTKGVMWFVTAIIGFMAVLIISILINRNKVLEYFGRTSLVVLCIHGSVYRVIVKILSLPLGMDTDAVRENFILSMIVMVITLVICAAGYEILNRFMPWIIGKGKLKAAKIK